MKKILLISDNHGYWDAAILHHAANADEVWHAGDWLNTELLEKLEEQGSVVRAVWGNADGAELRAIFPEFLAFDCEGLRVLMTHIGGYPGRYNKSALAEIMKIKPGLFVCGHSHILRVDRDPVHGNMFCMNPGACGLQGFHKIRTALRFKIDGGKLLEPEVIEFGSRK